MEFLIFVCRRYWSVSQPEFYQMVVLVKEGNSFLFENVLSPLKAAVKQSVHFSLCLLGGCGMVRQPYFWLMECLEHREDQRRDRMYSFHKRINVRLPLDPNLLAMHFPSSGIVDQ